MLKALHKIDFDAVPSLHLFDTLITPILNYNCEVWNQISKHKIEAINNKEYRLEKLYFDTPGENYTSSSAEIFWECPIKQV